MRVIGVWVLFTLAAACSGSPAQSGSHTEADGVAVEQKIEQVTSCLRPPVLVGGEDAACRPLANVMKTLKIPGLSIAVFHNGRIEWARGFGLRQIGGSPVDVDTLFQAGSISKPVTALAALRLVHEGKLTLDADVNTELISWKVPPSPAAKGKPVTLRELLTHTAAISVPGFFGYEAGLPVPSVIQVLNGERPANSPPVRVEAEPGSGWSYSGGGYTVIQQILVDTSNEPFAKLLNDAVLSPLGMTRSTYEQPLPQVWGNDRSTPYAEDGTPIPGGPHTYPELAAAGLWSTPSDIARYCLSVEESLTRKSNPVLSKEMALAMLKPGKFNWGLGVEIGGPSTDAYFMHTGIDAGFQSEFIAYEHHGDGAVVMTNSDSGMQLIDQVMSSIATVYGWPDLRPHVHTLARVSPTTLKRYSGNYQLGPGLDMAVTLGGNQLIVDLPWQPQVPIFPESQSKFFGKDAGVEIEFSSAKSSSAGYLILTVHGRETKALRH